MLDKKDRQILKELQLNSKLTTQQISKKTLIPITTIHNRIKRLEKDGIIKGYTVMLDHKKLGFDILAFILLTVRHYIAEGKAVTEEGMAKEIAKLPGVEETYIVTGGTDIIAKIRVRSMEDLNKFVVDVLRNLEGVENTQTLITLSTFRNFEN